MQQGGHTMTLTRPRSSELPTLREAIDRLFEDPFIRLPAWPIHDGFDRPAIDVYTTPEAYVIKAALPGIKPEDIHTTLTGEVLTIVGAFREEEKREEKGYLYRELSTGELRRSITLPRGLKTDAIEASYADGVLTLTIPKAEEVKPREIKVHPG
jgi:HSP20 family protein